MTSSSKSDKVKKAVEQFSPISVAAVSFIVLQYYKVEIVSAFLNGNWSVSSLYAAIFDWSAIQTGFLFGIYGFVASKKDGFIGEITGTYAMIWFISYIRRAIFTGFVLTFASIPLVVIDLSLVANEGENYVWISLWMCLFIWAFLSFARAAYIFGLMARVRDKEDLAG